jgi:hypothetical protein
MQNLYQYQVKNGSGTILTCADSMDAAVQWAKSLTEAVYIFDTVCLRSFRLNGQSYRA